jgi:hypothetical protein
VFVQPLPGAVDSAVLSQRQPALIVTVTTALRYLDREKEGLRRDLRQLYEEPPAGLLMCDSLLMGGAQRSAPDSAVLHSADVAHKDKPKVCSRLQRTGASLDLATANPDPAAIGAAVTLAVPQCYT